MTLGLYISVPFCRTKCSYCNFASDVFSKGAYEGYVARVLEDLAGARAVARELGCILPQKVDSIYLGGGTPSVLDPEQLRRIFAAVRAQFDVEKGVEATVECAPGTLTGSLVETLAACGVNRVSLGVQSFVDAEARAVGRLHNRATVLEDMERLRAAGIGNINVDLIAGLPRQTAESWRVSLAETLATGAPHASVYMLEVDEDSRLGRELIAGGTRYHAHFVPDEGATADLYEEACRALEQGGVPQYEISNFARSGFESRHNLKYWERRPYLGVGVDAHSMLAADAGLSASAMRFSSPESLDGYMNRAPRTVTPVDAVAAFEESFFLGLRLNRGVGLRGLPDEHAAALEPVIDACLQDGLLARTETTIALTGRGRLLSNEVFARFLVDRAELKV